MRSIDEIKKTSGIIIKKQGKDGIAGTVCNVYFKNGKMKISNKLEENLNFIFSTGCGFEHLSVSTPVRTPTWEQMSKMKEIFWNDDEVCMQLHPKKSEYVNNHPYCLHIWKPIDKEIPTPPSILVGIRNGHEIEDFKKIINHLDEMAKW